jgi:hypothetical protein
LKTKFPKRKEVFMKVKVKDRHYQFSPIFKLSSVIILVLSAIGIAGAVALFMFGMA